MILNVVNVPFWFVPEPSTPSELDVPFVGSCIAECLWPFLFDVPWLPDDPVEEENGDINPVFLMVELNEPMTASTCIILKAFLSFLYDDMCKFFFNFCLSLFFSSWNIPIKICYFLYEAVMMLDFIYWINMYEIDMVGLLIIKLITSSQPSFPCKDKMNENNLTKLELFINDSYE